MTRRSAPRSSRHWALHGLLIGVSALWLFPFLWAVYTSFRPYSETAARGYVSLPDIVALDNYAKAWQDGALLVHFLNTVVIVVPSVVTVLTLSTALAFVASRSASRLNAALLVVFACGSLLPPQAIVVPLLRLYLAVPAPAPLSDNGVLYDQLIGVALIHVAFQLGFCTFVLASFMRSIPAEVIDAGRLDGASIPRLLWSLIVPLSRPALAALAALETTWIYNDFLWALALVQTTAKRPVTTSLANLSGEFFTDYNVVAAGAVLVALPTLAVLLVARRHLTRGLALGATSG